MMATCTALSTTLLLFYYHNVLHSMIIDHFPIHVHVGIDRRKLLHVDCATPVDSRATAWQKWSHKKKCSHQPSTLAKPAVASSLSSPPSNRSSSSPTKEKKPSMKQYHRGQEQRQDACNHPNEDSRGVCAKMHNVTSRRFDGGGHWWQFQYEQGGRQQLSQSVDGWLAQRMCNPRRKVLEASSPAQQKHSNNNGHHNQKNNTLLPLLVHQGGRDSSSLRGAPTASSTSGAAEVAETSAGRSACVCYSGLLRGFADGAVAENHIAFLLDPMRQELSFQVVAVAFSLEGKEQIPDAILKKYSAVATHVRREAIAASPSSREWAGVGRFKGDAQYGGIFHCSLLFLALELDRGALDDRVPFARSCAPSHLCPQEPHAELRRTPALGATFEGTLNYVMKYVYKGNGMRSRAPGAPSARAVPQRVRSEHALAATPRCTARGRAVSPHGKAVIGWPAAR